jgi:hypothetical protein
VDHPTPEIWSIPSHTYWFINQTEPKRARGLLLLILRSIWLERNAWIFNNRARTVNALLDNLMKEVEKWKLVGLSVR